MTQEHDGQLPEKEGLREQSVEAVSEKEGGGKPRVRTHGPDSTAARPVSTSLLFAAAVAATLALLTVNTVLGRGALAARGAWVLFVGFIAYRLARTGRTSRWRSVFFVAMAWAFVFQFKSSGSPSTGPRALESPYCHIAIASSILNQAYNQYLAFRSGHWPAWGPLSLGFLWLAVTLVLGQAWCSWGCFYGGLDEGFSRVLPKALLRWNSLPGRLRELPAAILLVSILFSLTSVLPAFCLWACPLKLTTAFLDPNDLTRRLQLGLFAATLGGAIVLLPLLTKKRVFCGLLCPFGAWQSFWGNVNPFRVSIRAEACTQCRLCVKVCPTFAIEAEGLKEHVVSPYCNRCGECIDACPTGAMGYTLLGDKTWDARLLLIYCCLVVGGAVGGMFLP